MAVSGVLQRATRAGVSGAYLGFRWDFNTKEISAWDYDSAGVPGSVIGDPLNISDQPTGFFNTDRTRKSMFLIHSDSAGLVEDGALSFAYRSTSSTWRIMTWDLHAAVPTSYSSLYPSCEGIGGPIYSGGWLWFIHLTSTTLSLRKIRADLTGEVTVKSETISSPSDYRDDGRSGWLLLSSLRASTFKEAVGLVSDIPWISRDGATSNMSPGFSGTGDSVEDGSNGPEDSLGDAIYIAGNSTSADLYRYDGNGVSTPLWPSGWNIGLALGGVNTGCYLNPAKTEAVVFPVHVGSTVLVRTRLDGSYTAESPIPSVIPQATPAGGIFAILPRA